jgi:arginine exporter protein ArgO
LPVVAWTPFVAGLAAGLGIALPLGAIGVLILREGVERGIRMAAVAAFAVATVDFAYALVAVVVGERVAQALAEVERIVQLVGAAALTLVVIIGVRDLLRGLDEPAGDAELPVGYGGTFLRFVGLTAINPMTAVYFVALTAGLSQRLAGAGAGTAFAIGVLIGSLAWQMVLALGGGLAGGRMSQRLRIGVSLAGYTIVVGYALRLALGG